MPGLSIAEITAQLEKMRQADDKIDTTKPEPARRKFPAWYREQLNSTYAQLVALNAEVPVDEGARRLASGDFQRAMDEAEELLRNNHARIRGLRPVVNQIVTNKPAIFNAYGFVAERVGELTDDRVITLLGIMPEASASLQSTQPQGALDASWLDDAQALLSRLEAARPNANIGQRSDAVHDRRDVLDKADDLISRCHGFLTFALPERDEDPLMHEYGFTPRRKPVRHETPKPPQG